MLQKLQEFNECIREAIEIIISVRGNAEIRIFDIFDIKHMSKKDIFTKRNINLNGKPAIFYGDISRKYDCFAQEVIIRYISFYLNYKDTVRDYIYKKSTGEKVKRLKKIDFENILITIPSLEVQNKITDNFIELKRKFENDIINLEEKIKIIDENSKVYMEHIFKFY